MNSIQPNHKFQSSNYKLKVSGYHGNGGDSFDLDRSSTRRDGTAASVRNGMQFSTFDKYNDQLPVHCAKKGNGYGGGAGWWNACGLENLNGYNYGHAKISTKCMSWSKWECLKSITMAIRPV